MDIGGLPLASFGTGALLNQRLTQVSSEADLCNLDWVVPPSTTAGGVHPISAALTNQHQNRLGALVSGHPKKGSGKRTTYSFFFLFFFFFVLPMLWGLIETPPACQASRRMEAS